MHCEVAAAKKIRSIVVGIFTRCRKIYKECKKCKELRNFTQTTLHLWARKEEPWSRVHMDHEYITGVELLLLLADSFSGWPEVIRVLDKKDSTIKQILRVIFLRNGEQKPWYPTIHQNFFMKVFIYCCKK